MAFLLWTWWICNNWVSDFRRITFYWHKLSKDNLRKALNKLAPAFLWPQQLNVPGRKGTGFLGQKNTGSTLGGYKEPKIYWLLTKLKHFEGEIWARVPNRPLICDCESSHLGELVHFTNQKSISQIQALVLGFLFAEITHKFIRFTKESCTHFHCSQ